MVQRLLVPLDGSSLATRALEFVTWLAQRSHSTHAEPALQVLLFRAIDPALLYGLEVPGPEPVLAQAVGQATRSLEALAVPLRRQGISVETVVRPGHPVEEMVACAQVHHVDWMVLSTHGHSGLVHWVLGSVAERVMQRSPVPVLLLPATTPPAFEARDAHEDVAPLRLLVPLDGSRMAEAALPLARDLAQQLHAELRLLSVVDSLGVEQPRPQQTPPVGATSRRRMRQMERYLQRTVATLNREGIFARWSLSAGRPAEQIMEETHLHQISLLVLTTQGQGGQMGRRYGRVVEALIQQSLLPLLVVPSPTTEEHGEATHPQQ